MSILHLEQHTYQQIADITGLSRGNVSVRIVRLKEKLEVRYTGKLATFILYGAIPSFYLAAGGLAGDIFLYLGWVFGVIGLVLYYWVAVLYAVDIRDKLRHG